MKTQSCDLLIIGEGLAALGLLEGLSKQTHQFESIVTLDGETLAPACAFKTTGLVARNGIERNVSALGDLLVDGFEQAQDFFENHHCPGVEKPQVHHYAREGEELVKLQRRFGLEESQKEFSEKGYLIDPEQFIPWWKARLEILHEQWESRGGVVTQIEGKTVHLLDGETLSAKKIVIATGAYQALLPLHSYNQSKIMGKSIPGHYYHWENVDWGEESKVFGLAGQHLLYRGRTRELLLGGSTEKDGVMAMRENSLKEFYREIAKFVDQPLPKIELAKLHTGLRQKGQRRHPYCDHLPEQKDHFVLGNYYKNGWSLCFSLGQSMAELICR
jgi:glycine/D-amino acid oxidase-like deaminating enzyme